MFQCIRIPADASAPMETISLSKSGGLTNDALAAHAKQYFSDTYLAADTDTASDPFAAASCLDIMAVTVPTTTNHHTAVSLYKFGGDSPSQSLPVNTRSMALVQACGHAISSPIHGDVFVGRAHDDETADVWERVDFTIADTDPKAAWCRTARQTGGGGGSGAAAASSLSGILQQTQKNNVQIVGGGNDDNGAAAAASLSFGMNGAPAVEAQGYSWTQDGDEIEVKCAVPPEVVSKDCKVQFGRNALKVVVAGQTLVEGATFLPVVADECTYTLTQEAGAATKDLTLTLMKEESSKTWTFVVQ